MSTPLSEARVDPDLDNQRAANGQTPVPDAADQPTFAQKLRRALVIDEKAINTDEVSFGSIVHVKDQKSGDSQKFQIVGSTEADPLEHKLSNESPIGKALIGRKRNDVVSVEVPRGPKKKLKITKIETA